MVVGEGDDQEVIPIAMKDIIDGIVRHTGGAPYRVGEILFVPVDQRVDWLTNSDHLFAYLHRAVGGVNWENTVRLCQQAGIICGVIANGKAVRSR